jgi:hypothetical protein
MSGWYYARPGKTIGPLSEPEMRELFARGTIGLDEPVWTEGMERWAPARGVHPFSTLAGPPTPGSPPALAPRTCPNCDRLNPGHLQRCSFCDGALPAPRPPRLDHEPLPQVGAFALKLFGGLALVFAILAFTCG